LLFFLDVTALFQPFPMLAQRRAQAWQYQPAFRRPRHFHEEPEINLVTRGRGVILLGDRAIPVSTGSVVWFAPGLDHYLEEASPDFELFTLGFQPESIKAFEREHLTLARFARPAQRIDAASIAQLSDLLSELQTAADAQAVEERLLQVLQKLSQLGEAPEACLGHRAASFILTHPTTSRDQLARALRSNRGDVSRCFHRDHGMTLRQYRNAIRTLEFLRQLDAGAANMTRAAIGAGFGSYSQCHRVFHALLGQSPREYLNAQRRENLTDRFEPIEST
jgi:AraC-like DNA-binding protein